MTGDIIPAPSGNNWIIGNLNYIGYYMVNYDVRNWNALIDQLIVDHKVSIFYLPIKFYAVLFEISRTMCFDAK